MKALCFFLSLAMAASSSAFAADYYCYQATGDTANRVEVERHLSHFESGGNRLVDVWLNGIEIEDSVTELKQVDQGVEYFISTSKGVLLDIRNATSRGPWQHRTPGWFAEGDSRTLKGDFVINGKSATSIDEIYCGED